MCTHRLERLDTGRKDNVTIFNNRRRKEEKNRARKKSVIREAAIREDYGSFAGQQLGEGGGEEEKT